MLYILLLLEGKEGSTKLAMALQNNVLALDTMYKFI